MTETFDFDQIIDRSNTSSLKWEKYRGRDILPMWVAESDFAIAPAICSGAMRASPAERRATLHEKSPCSGSFGRSNVTSGRSKAGRSPAAYALAMAPVTR